MKYSAEMAVLKQEAAGIMKMHYAPASAGARATQGNKYRGFCEEFGLVPIPCDSERVVLYIAYMARTMKVSSIRDYLSGLNHLLKFTGATPIDYQNYKVHMAIEGIKHKLGMAVKRAAPLLPRQLVMMFSHLTENRGHVTFRAALLTSFRGLLRKQNVTDSPVTLLRSDICMTSWGMMVSIRGSKTIQYGDRVLKIPIARLSDQTLCAVYWTARHFKEIPAPPSSPAFLRAPGAALEYETYMDILKYVAEEAGLNPRDYSSHSLRRGGTSYLRSVGASIEELKVRGDWKSDAVMLYIQQPIEERIAFDLRVANELDAALE